MDIVDRLYELVKDNNANRDIFDQNIDLFRSFYYDYMHIDFYGEKVITIYKYLLSLNIPEGYDTMPYINCNIIQDLNMYEGMFIHSVYSSDFEVNDTYCDRLFDLIDLIEEFRSLGVESSLNKLVSRDNFVRDYTGAMILALNKGFFDLSDEKILAMSNAIKNNEYLEKTIKEGLGEELMDKDYIFQYAHRYLFTAEFMDDENLENDQLAIALREGKIRDYKLLERIFTRINGNMLLRFFDNGNLSNALDTIEKTTEDNDERKVLFNNIISKAVDNAGNGVMAFLINDSRKEKYIDEDKEKRLIEYFIKHYPDNISEEEVKYIISNKYRIDGELYEIFRINLRTEIEKGKISKEYESEAIPNLPNFDPIHDLLEKMFLLNKTVDNHMIMAVAIKRLVEGLTDNKVKVLFDLHPEQNGCAYTDDSEMNTITLNYGLIEKLCDTEDRKEYPESLKIFETIFHELRHVEQFDKMRGRGMLMDGELLEMYKEDVIGIISSNYYGENYFGISFEKDARICGARKAAEFFREHFSFMEEAIAYFENNEKNEEAKVEKVDDSKIIFELSGKYTTNEILSKLISINKDILRRFKPLQRVFNVDGTKINTGINY